MCPNQKQTLWKKIFHKIYFELQQNYIVTPVHTIILNSIKKFHQQNEADEKNLDYNTTEILKLQRKTQSSKKSW